jgi:hypothetical protein
MADNPVLCRVHLRHPDQPRWLRLTLSLRPDADEGRFLDYSSRFTCRMEGIDAPASEYSLENWESGLLSGLFHASRRLGKPPARLMVSELKGRLLSEEMTVLALAAALGVTELLGGDVSGYESQLAGWNVRLSLVRRLGRRIRSPQ